MFSNPLIELDMLSAMEIWGELVEAYHNLNGFGGNTAEIYAYRLQRFEPQAIEAIGGVKKHRDKLNQKTANQLAALIEEFARQWECKILIDDQTPEAWLRQIQDGFNHRAHVKVINQKQKARPGSPLNPSKGEPL